MCGIAGAIWNDPSTTIDEPTLRRMTEVLRHRGPDDDGYYLSEFLRREPYEPQPGVALGHRRLSIIDLEGGHQPMHAERDTVWTVFNGEIYNFVDLRRRLEGAGHTFRSNSDTETLVHLYEDEGPEMFSHLNGMFAFAIYDADRRRLLLARDRLGQKPLYYRLESNRLLFASQLKSILEVPGVPRELDHGTIDEYLTYQYCPHPNTIFKGIKKLPPGHYAIWQDGRFDVQPYWQPDLNRESFRSEQETIEQLRELFTDSVRLRLQADVPLGAFLSGGVDSSLVVALMQQLSSQPVKTFSIGFPVAEYDETHYAKLVAEHVGTEHHEFLVTPDCVSIIDKLVWHYDEPFADSSAVPTWYVSEQTRQHVTVALSGDGGDELFAGYDRYKAVSLAGTLDGLGASRILGAKAWQALPGGGRERSLSRRIKRFSEALSESPARRYLRWIGIFGEAQRADLYTDEFVASLPESDPVDFVSSQWKRARDRDAVTQASLGDMFTYLPCDLNTKVDVASMAHGLECRQPMLDHRLAELAIAMPRKMKRRGRRGKRILRKAFGDLLPAEIFNRRKMGFGVPVGRWLREDLKPMLHDTLMAGDARCHAFFRAEAITTLVDQHESRRYDHSYRLWALLFLELWLREWVAT